MAFCRNCGAQLAKGAAFCNNCGAAQAQQPMQPQMQQPQMQQPQMQQPQMQQQPQFVQQQYAQQQQFVPQQPAPQKSRTGLIAGLAAGGTALVAGIVVLILFLTGVIGGKDNDPPSPAPVAGSSVTSPDIFDTSSGGIIVTTTVEATTDEPVPTPEPTPSLSVNRENPEVSPLPIGVHRNSANAYRPDSEARVYVCADGIGWPPDTGEKAYERIREISDDSRVSEQALALKEQLMGPAGAEEGNNYLLYVENLCAWRVDSAVVSMMRETEQSGFWGNEFKRQHAAKSYNYHAKTGEEIRLTDVVTDVDALAEYVTGRLLETEYDENNWFYDDLKIKEADLANEIGKLLKEGKRIQFGLAPYNLMIILEDGVLYDERGNFRLLVPFADLPELFDPVYTETPTEFIAELLPAHDNRILVNGKERLLRAEIDESTWVEGLTSGDYILTLDGKEIRDNAEGLLSLRPLLVHAWSGDYLWILGSHMSSANHSSVIVYRFEGDELEYVGTTERFGGFFDTLTAGYLVMWDTLWTIGTTSGYRFAYVGEDGMPTVSSFEGKTDPYDMYDGGPLTVKQSLICEAIWDYGEGSVQEAGPAALEPGDVLNYYRTDGETYVDFHLGNGGLMVRLYYEQGPNGITVNGILVDDLFENILWAG